MLWKETVFSAF